MPKASYNTALATIAVALSVLLLMPASAVGQGFGEPFQEEGAPGSQAEDESTPFVHGLTIGIGMSTYQGDLS